ncbi:MAG: patatin-like phospholipase family protein [Candidatus Omnitrophica bacterium]|nr:patatin-like phospholipase family protein [Candidatus Omnitrophota bacterium]
MNAILRLQEKLSIIERLPLFADLSLKDKRLVAKASALVEYKKDDILYKELDLADALYCVITGRLKAYVRRDGKAEVLEYLKRGKYVGIISLLTGEPHSVTVQAVNDSIVLKISKDEFGNILKHIPHLAIHFGQTLSRRLKRKDVREKKIFESTIISIMATSERIGTTTYAVNFALSLKLQTRKKIILVILDSAGEDVIGLLGITAPLNPIAADRPFFDDSNINIAIFKHPSGIDILNIRHKNGGNAYLIQLLSFLTGEYHYVVVDLPSHIDKTSFESLKQSDMLHILTASDETNLHMTGSLISELEKSSTDISLKIKVIISEHGKTPIATHLKRQEILKHDIFATLPEIDKSGEGGIDISKIPLVTEYPECEYSKAVRRISREAGDCLIGLALSSGAAMGLAHAGILKIIEKERIPIDIVVGTSTGALIGALWASGKDTAEMEEIASRFRRKIAIFRLIDLAFPKRGLIKGREVRRFLLSQFGDMTFYDLKLPFKIIACDIEKREEVVLDRGSLVDCLMASIAIPGVFEPVTIEGRCLVDGGIINPLPTNLLMRLGVSKIIAVNALPSPSDVQRSKRKVSNIFDVIVNSIQASEYLLAERSCQDADVAMHPVVPTVDWYEFYESAKVVKRGEEEALKYLPQLKELAI